MGIRLISIDINKAQLTERIFKAARIPVTRAIETKAKRETTDKLKRYHKAAFDQVRGLLKGGVPGLDKRGGARAIRFRYPDGSAGRYVTSVPWEPLTPGYRYRKPANVNFWYKRGLLYRDYGAAVGAANYKAASTKTLENKDKKGLLSYTVSWETSFQGVPEPFQTLITQSLLSGAEHKYSGVGINRHTVQRIAYVEGRRPFISGMSALIGRRMEKDVRNSIIERARKLFLSR